MHKSNVIMRVKDITCRYSFGRRLGRRGHVDALKGITFDLMEGETLGIIGKNGTGKSTLLRILAGILEPDSGSVERPEGISCSILNLRPGFSSELTGRENILLGGMLNGYTRQQIAAKEEEIIAFSEIEEFIDMPIKRYSTGMTARLGFSLAFHMQPTILLIDEVFAVGDLAFQIKAAAAMKSHMRSEKTMVFVSHHMPLVKTLCSRVIFMHKGEIKDIGDPEAMVSLYEKS